MSETTIDGKPRDEILLEELKDVIKKNTEITSEQNRLLIKYTRGQFWLTIGIGIIALYQLILIIWQVITLFRR